MRYTSWRFRRDDTGNEAVAAPGHGLKEARVVGVVSERVAQPLDGRVQTVVEVNKGVGGPEFFAQLLSRDQFSRPLQKSGQKLKWLILESHFEAASTQLPTLKVNFKRAKLNKT
jgi:hypothetical protein